VLIDSARGPESLIAITEELIAASEREAGRPVIVDFSSLKGRNTSVELPWGAVLSNILASRFGDTPLGAALPADHSARVQLARAGVYFALARNRRFDWTSLRGGTDRIVRRWSRDWAPAEVQQPLFRIDSVQGDEQPAPATVEPDIVAFLNPDRVPPTVMADDSAAVIFPWLRDLVGRTATGTSRLDRGMQQDISLVVFELLGNVREHARLGRHNQCAMNLFVTDGGHGSRLYLTVSDTGVGMPKTLARISYPEGAEADERVAAAFDGRLPTRERDRGRGLHRITGLVERLSGRLFVATGPTPHGAVVVQHTGGAGVPVTARFVPNLEVAGTVVMLTLPVPGSVHRNASECRVEDEGR